MRFQTTTLEFRSNIVIIVTSIQTNVLWRLSTRFRQNHANRVQRCWQKFHVMPVRAVDHESER